MAFEPLGGVVIGHFGDRVGRKHMLVFCLLAMGLGEAPLLRQATFSLWDSAAAMDAYARTGAHLDAIRAAWKHQFFSESMFVRFVPLQLQGQWKGRWFA